MTQAISLSSYGGPDVLTLTDIPAPQVSPGRLLVRTQATGVNFIETYQRAGVYPVPLPFTPGAEGSGIVEAVGEGVDTFSVGDRVTTTEASGTYAETFVVDADRAYRIPDAVDSETAAAVPLQGLTAHYLCTSAYAASAGDVAVVHAGAGGVGLLLTQMLAARGVTVITTTSTEEKAALSREAGASYSCGYRGFGEQVREITGGAGASVVFDGVGKTTFDESLSSLRVRGTMVLFGGASGQVPPFDLQRLNAGGSLSITRPSLGHFLLTAEERAWRYTEVFNSLVEGSLKVRIGARFSLEDAGAAHRALESRATTGKVILTPPR